MHSVLAATLLITSFIALETGAETPPPYPENQIIGSAKLEPNPPVIFKVRNFQGLKWKNILLPPGKDPYIRANNIPGADGPPLQPLPEDIEADDVERRKRSIIPTRPRG